MNLPDFLIALENLFFASFAVGNQKSTRTEKVMKKISCRTASPKIKDKAIPGGSIKSFLLKLKKISNNEKLFFGLKATRISLK